MRIKGSGYAKNGEKMTQTFKEVAKTVQKHFFPADEPVEECNRVYTDFYSLSARTPSVTLAE